MIPARIPVPRMCVYAVRSSCEKLYWILDKDGHGQLNIKGTMHEITDIVFSIKVQKNDKVWKELFEIFGKSKKHNKIIMKAKCL